MSHLAVQAPRTTGREAVLAFLEIDRQLRALERIDAAASGRLRLALVSLRQRFERGLIDPIAAKREADLLLHRADATGARRR
ncbi:hypothetical protein [Agromyces silvae]|uniref:hypothetical protein n=1 Tax=Agromyces silvae TaxID=3388266 RepID=UPI00280B1CA2|nr:hypothetical protein [Agromyces protaetiae]